jgi:hypothetical protein
LSSYRKEIKNRGNRKKTVDITIKEKRDCTASYIQRNSLVLQRKNTHTEKEKIIKAKGKEKRMQKKQKERNRTGYH